MSNFKIKSLVLLSLFCLFFKLQAQVKDSIANALKLQIKQADSDSLRINLKLDLAGRVGLFDLDSAIVIVKDVEKEIRKIDENTAFYKKTKGTILRSLANAETTKENWADALDYHIKTVEYNTKINDSIGLGIAYTGLSTIYLKLKDLPAAQKYIKKALDIQKYKSTPNEYSYSHIKLAHIFYVKKELDSAVMMFNKAKRIDTSKQRVLAVESNLASVYKLQKKYDKALEINKRTLKLTDPNDHKDMGIRYGNLASTYGLLEDWENALKAVDSCIFFYTSIGKKRQLELAYKNKASYLYNLNKYKQAYKAQANYKVYSDSVNNVAEQKRITEIQLNHKFEKEKELTAAQLKSETSKKKFYFALLLLSLLSAILLFYFIKKTNKQRLKLANNALELKDVEKLKVDLALANRENKLKDVIVENSITEEVLNKTLDDIKEIITFQDEKERQVALRSLSADLLSEKATHKSSSNIQSYLDEIHLDFKIKVDTKHSQLTAKDKELIYLMKAGLTSSQISKVLNTTLSAIKSNRYRIRKKLNLSANDDIIAFIDG